MEQYEEKRLSEIRPVSKGSVEPTEQISVVYGYSRLAPTDFAGVAGTWFVALCLISTTVFSIRVTTEAVFALLKSSVLKPYSTNSMVNVLGELMAHTGEVHLGLALSH